MTLSYIIPTYNPVDADLRRCLDSLTRQGLARADYEVIVVDDGSAHSPETVVQEFEGMMNIRLLRQPHARQGAARNRGIECATGEYVRFVDSDDYLPPSSALPLLELMASGELDVLLFRFSTTEAVTSAAPRLNAIFADGPAYMSRHTLFGSPCTLCFRRRLTDHPSPLRFAENTFIEDEAFVTRLLWRAGRTGVTSAVGYIYVQHPASTTHLSDPDHTDDLFRAYFAALDDIRAFRQTQPEGAVGLDRKIRYLSIDILRHALRQRGGGEARFDQCAAALRQRDLFPLPRGRYSWKYNLFRILSPHAFGRALLRLSEHKKGII